MTEAAHLQAVPDPAPDLTFGRVRQEMHELVLMKGWYAASSSRPQTPRNLAMSLSIETSELLECFQWADEGDPVDVADELADIILYATQLATVMNISLAEAVRAKLARNRGRTWDTGSAG